MDLEILKKKVSTFRGEGGRVRVTDDALMMQILLAREQWTGPAKSFYPAIGVSQTGMASIIGRAKKLRREGAFPADDFKAIAVTSGPQTLSSGHLGPCQGVELIWDGGRLIRFQEVNQLLEFLKQAS